MAETFTKCLPFSKPIPCSSLHRERLCFPASLAVTKIMWLRSSQWNVGRSNMYHFLPGSWNLPPNPPHSFLGLWGGCRRSRGGLLGLRRWQSQRWKERGSSMAVWSLHIGLWWEQETHLYNIKATCFGIFCYSSLSWLIHLLLKNQKSGNTGLTFLRDSDELDFCSCCPLQPGWHFLAHLIPALSLPGF